MKHITKLDDTAARLGIAMRNARQTCRMSHDEVATLLRVMPDDLLKYEFGTTQIPADVLEHIVVLGYKLMRIRMIEDKYRRQRRVFNQIKKSVSGAR